MWTSAGIGAENDPNAGRLKGIFMFSILILSLPRPRAPLQRRRAGAG